MVELNCCEVERVSAGVLPLILATLVADVGLIAAMKGAGYW